MAAGFVHADTENEAARLQTSDRMAFRIERRSVTILWCTKVMHVICTPFFRWYDHRMPSVVRFIPAPHDFHTTLLEFFFTQRRKRFSCAL